MRGKTRYWVVAVVLVAGILLFLPSRTGRRLTGWVRDAVAPYQALSSGVDGRVRRVGELWQRRRDRGELETELDFLRREVIRLSGVDEQNAVLRRQLGYFERSALDLVPCRVIARGDMTGWWRTVRVNRGSASGIQPGMAVVSESGLVGQILQTSRQTADILLISDASSRVAVRVMPAGVFGLLEGGPPHLQRRDRPHVLLPSATLTLDFLDLDGGLREGDRVVTSGLGEVFPPDLLIGTLTGLRTDPSGLYRRAGLTPAADLERLDTLYAVRALHREAPP